MVYKNFKQEATIFKVRLIPKPLNIFCIPPNQTPIPQNPVNFYKQSVDIIFVNFHIKQYTSFPTARLPPCYDPDPQPINNEEDLSLDNPEFNVQGYYILSIIPTRVYIIKFPTNIEEDCNFNNITKIGLFQYYIKAGYYACKPLDYTGQCIIRSFPINPIARVVPQKINVEYAYIGHRLNGQEPFNRLFGFTPDEKIALSTYSEQIIRYPDNIKKLTRSMTNVKSDIKKTNTLIAQVNSECDDNNDNDHNDNDHNDKKQKTQGGKLRKTNKNKKQYKNKLQTYKRKGKGKRERKTKKNYKKRRTRKN
jgi:hypothetical protein